ncbi:ABC transporter permease [Roseicyclus sp. F158]|uniref:ABC transporter permease n=1 Tax=Tropicimonas omnivorans TaxID=3075590 RepID=A0ABU3DHF2_9RHOB|nr:ABC transporter permease [Roseicyclus sp. F158]MDT0683139.1 ABC transporter permease [Roseicyclus sp. F158]
MTTIPDPRIEEIATDAEASQWRLTWRAFKRHRLALVSLWIIVAIYLIALFAEVVAPYDPHATSSTAVYHPPQAVHFIDRSDDGFAIRPWVQKMTLVRDPMTLSATYEPAEGEKVYLSIFGKGDEYSLWGLFDGDRHLVTGADPDERFYLFGTDRLGRDMLSRTIYGARISMSVGLLGVTFSLIIGTILGGFSGYYGGRIDMVVQRLVELILALPTIPIWLGLSAALPQDWSPLSRYFAITVILSLVGWTELARVVRGRFLALRTEEFVTAARLDGGSQWRVIFRHMMPSMASHIIASVTLAIPAMIVAETALSFIGLGLTPPIISWGVLLKEAQNIRSIAQAPWLFIPGGAVCVAILALNFLGDGLRDAADPYSNAER